MAYFEGRIQGPNLEPTFVTTEVADGRFRIVAGRRHLGSWSLERISVERTSIYKFALDIENDSLEFFPEDPTAFSDAVGAVIDLRESKGRYGLKSRIQRTLSS